MRHLSLKRSDTRDDTGSKSLGAQNNNVTSANSKAASDVGRSELGVNGNYEQQQVV